MKVYEKLYGYINDKLNSFDSIFQILRSTNYVPDARAKMIQKFVLPSQFLKFLYSIALETNSDMFTIAKNTLNMMNCPLFLAYGTDNCRGIIFDVKASQNVFGFRG